MPVGPRPAEKSAEAESIDRTYEALKRSFHGRVVTNCSPHSGAPWISVCCALFLAGAAYLAAMALAAIVVAPGLLIRALASGHVRKNEALATSGPYA